MAHPDYDKILATTLANHKSTLVDNAFGARALFFWLRETQSVSTDGGESLVFPVNFKKNTTVGSYSGTDTLDISASDGPTVAKYEWKQHYGSVTIDGLQQIRNSGEARRISLMAYYIEQAYESIFDDLHTMFWGDGTGNAGKDMLGLQKLIGDNTNAAMHGTGLAGVGGIDPTSETLWQSQEFAAVGALSLAAMRTAFHDASVGPSRPKVIIMPQDLYEAYEALLEPTKRLEDVAMANHGFQTLTMYGVPVTYDRSCPAGQIYMINTDYLELVFHQDRMLAQGEFIRPEDKDLEAAQILTAANLVITNRNRQAVLKGVTAA